MECSMSTGILSACVGMAGILLALAAGWHFGVKTAYATLRQIARNKLNDADYAAFCGLLERIKEATAP